MARAFTKPTITMRGMNRISFATPRAAGMIWRMPARMAVAMVTAMTKLDKSPTCGSTPAMIENEIASGMSASATTSHPAPRS